MSEEGKGRKLDGFNIEIEDALDNLKELIEGGKNLREIDVSKAGDYKVFPPLTIKGSGEWEPSAGDAKIKIGASVASEYVVRGYNSVDDKDDDAVIVFDNGNFAWLKHELMASAEAKFAGKVGEDVTFGIDASAAGSVRLLDYRRHRANSLAGNAVIANIKSARFPFKRPDVLALGAGDALAVVIRGRLAFEAKVSYSWAMTAGVAALDRVLGVAGAGNLKVSAGASLAVSYSVQDDYKLVFKKGKELAVLADIKKTRGTQKGVDGKIAIEVGFSDPDQLASLIENYLRERLGSTLPKIRDLLDEVSDATSVDDLPEALQGQADAIAARIGLTNLQTQFTEFQERLDDLEENLRKKLKEALKQKITVQLTFSYTRIETDETLLACEMSENRFKNHHRELLLGNLAPVTDHLAKKSSGFKLVKYLKTETITEKSSFGVSVAIGDWLKFGGVQESETTWKSQKNIYDHVRLSFDGRYSNQVSFTKEDDTYGYEIGAAMENFALNPRGSDFTYRWVLGTAWSCTHTNKKKRSRFFDKVIDDANVLGATEPAGYDDVKKTLEGLKGKVDAEIEITVDDKGFRKLAAMDLATIERAWPRAMAASLPPVYNWDVKLRGRLDDRLRIYGHAARAVFDSDATSSQVPAVDYSASGYDMEDRRRLKALDELNFQAYPHIIRSQLTYSVKTLWKPLSLGYHRERCRQFHDWLEELDLLRKNAMDRKVLGEIFESVRQHFRQERTYFRLMSNVIVTVLRESGAGDCLTATLKVTPETGKAVIWGR